MKRPLCLAIALALSLAAGCSTTDPRQAAEAPKPDPVLADGEHKDENAVLESIVVTGNRVREADRLPPRDQVAGRTTSSELAKRRADASAAATVGPAREEPMPALLVAAPPAPPMPMGAVAQAGQAPASTPMPYSEPANRENYADLDVNPIQRVAEQPVSTFSIDVDSGSYANVRRMLVGGSLPPSDAIRVEEMINYFDYGYAPPATAATPFSVTTELAPAPWNPDRQLLLVGIKGFEVSREKIPASNLVFLIDTSGSMQSPDKIDLLKQAFAQMVDTLRPQDRVSIVAYAGSAGLVLPSTPGSDKSAILAALEQLQAGGSTNGGAGIELAYATAQQHFIDGGVNRVVLATDGDFNVGTVDIDALKTLVEARRESGIALTTLGFGTGNYNDELSEQLADIGNGNHAYIDTLGEARKVLIDELSSTMLTIAKDVKIQMEFNPAVVAEYRLIGYENRALRREDFNNDRVDAGEIGAGHDVTALYELALVGSAGTSVDPLRYGADAEATNGNAGELGFLRLRYKAPDADVSRLIEQPIATASRRNEPSERLQFAASVAAFADSLRGGKHLGRWTLDDVAMLAKRGRGEDRDGYRGEFIALVEKARALKGGTVAAIAAE
jgi:Ca-activated chloride channel family protein